ncbi:WhiB family transcriptional regulator [Saccharopolyspora sp. K220]|uniref:WhiB family transcriptional regulator n=1 Tax=Saccharopolyspora soli TaxID=2926618 RepID=UPI001F596D4E|nr:WhiB family transcriptional regulator [Saccharopolyspora soli]MCI2421534.1 WhiB family transcriptional regulator [Saccharopolyspora soli]
MRTRVTAFLAEQLDRARRFADADGWKLLDLVDNTPERNCAGIPVDLFFPSLDEFGDKAQKLRHREKIAQKCEGCPVADECLAGALLRGERYGGWGGVAQPDFQELGRIWRRENPAHVADPSVDRSGCTAKRHGDRSAYVGGCRCEDAREADRRYKAALANGRARSGVA